MKWKSKSIRTSRGTVEGIAPEVISASRSTDIPAYYAEWFFKRLDAGYTKWLNPFNQKVQYISLEDTRAVIFWSKNPKPLLPYTHILDQKKIAFYIQFTVNNYELEKLEPCVPSLSSRIDTFKTFSDRIGPERVIWRFDPLLLTNSTTPDNLLEKISNIGSSLAKYTSKFVFSFADICTYKKVQNNLKRHNITHREFNSDDIHFLASEISKLCSSWNIPAYTCGEKINLSEYGIQHNKCIDDKLILKITNNHPDILRLFKLNSTEQLTLIEPKSKIVSLKDTGQRDECCCVMSKDIGQYNTCLHKCVYCYANTSNNVVADNFRKHSPADESIVPG